VARRTYKPKSFEGIGGKFKNTYGRMQADTSANIYESMLQSAAFMDLSARQRLLYVYMKAQYYGKRKPGKDYPDMEKLQDDDLFYFSMAMAEEYGLYTRSNHTRFYADIKELERHGFIKTVSNGKKNKKKSIYRFSADWQQWKEG